MGNGPDNYDAAMIEHGVNAAYEKMARDRRRARAWLVFGWLAVFAPHACMLVVCLVLYLCTGCGTHMPQADDTTRLCNQALTECIDFPQKQAEFLLDLPCQYKPELSAAVELLEQQVEISNGTQGRQDPDL